MNIPLSWIFRVIGLITIGVVLVESQSACAGGGRNIVYYAVASLEGELNWRENGPESPIVFHEEEEEREDLSAEGHHDMTNNSDTVDMRMVLSSSMTISSEVQFVTSWDDISDTLDKVVNRIGGECTEEEKLYVKGVVSHYLLHVKNLIRNKVVEKDIHDFGNIVMEGLYFLKKLNLSFEDFCTLYEIISDENIEYFKLSVFALASSRLSESEIKEIIGSRNKERIAAYIKEKFLNDKNKILFNEDSDCISNKEPEVQKDRKSINERNFKLFIDILKAGKTGEGLEFTKDFFKKERKDKKDLYTYFLYLSLLDIVGDKLIRFYHDCCEGWESHFICVLNFLDSYTLSQINKSIEEREVLELPSNESSICPSGEISEEEEINQAIYTSEEEEDWEFINSVGDNRFQKADPNVKKSWIVRFF